MLYQLSYSRARVDYPIAGGGCQATEGPSNELGLEHG